ncbi:pentatricopeptide repeat-containing protein At1g10910, chloroplastic-like isoform X2 [Rutidosis leptorrhynchoides]|uniref:pentatricopeptide repeat-containing protein At1g10910, chloroplastic-like isoform X2 n=1 Tax=Rutidosis leptorrhynchoides TaxID=125765 RepID=UPI003A999E75
MEISHVLGHRIQSIFCTLSSPSQPLPYSTRRMKNYQSLPANSVSTTPNNITTNQTHFRGRLSYNSSNKSKENNSISQQARQAAMLDIQQSQDLMLALSRSGVVLKVQDLNVIMREFGKQNRLKDLSQQNVNLSFASYSSYIKHMGRSLHPNKAMEIYDGIEDKLIKVNPSVCNSVLGCLIKGGKIEKSFELFRLMKRDGLVPDVVTYSTLLAGCAKVEDGYSKAIELVQELKYKGLVMDSVIYGTIISVCASCNQCKEAETYFNQMKSEGHVPNIFHYSSLINAYSVGGSYDKAEEILKEMKLAGLVPNKVVLTTLLKVYVRGGLFEKARELLNELEVLGYAEEEMPYCLLMDALSKAGQIDEAKLVFTEMTRKNVRTDGYSYSIMISALCRYGLLEEAKQLASEFEAKYEKYDVVIMNTMLCAYCRTGEMESVMNLMKKMDTLAINPDRNTFHILIKYFVKEKLYMLAFKTLQDMHNRGQQPDEELCSNLILHLGKTGAHAEAYSVYNMLRYGKKPMCKDLHEKILYILIGGRLYKDAYVVFKDNARLISRPAMKRFSSTFMRFGNINLINDVMKAIHNSGYKIGQGLFSMAVTRYIDQPEKKDLLLQLLEWMTGQGYIVDSSTRNLILKNSDLLGRQQTAEILAKQHVMSKAIKTREMSKK